MHCFPSYKNVQVKENINFLQQVNTTVGRRLCVLNAKSPCLKYWWFGNVRSEVPPLQKWILICISYISTAADVVKYKARSRTMNGSFNCSRCTELTEMPEETNLERQVLPLCGQFRSQKSARSTFLRLVQFQYLETIFTRFLHLLAEL